MSVLPTGFWWRRLARRRSSDFIHFAGNAFGETILVEVKVIAAFDKFHRSIAAQSFKRVVLAATGSQPLQHLDSVCVIRIQLDRFLVILQAVNVLGLNCQCKVEWLPSPLLKVDSRSMKSPPRLNRLVQGYIVAGPISYAETL